MATADADGGCDASPKGDPAGQLVHVIDDRTIALAERPGNRRADGYRNILENPHVGLVFLIPGRGDTLRINGRARLVSDAPFFDEMVVKGHRPLLAVVVEIDEVFHHCQKAFLRSGLWDPGDVGPERGGAAARGDRARARGAGHSPSRSSTPTTGRRTPRGSTDELRVPQGPRHGERLRAAARPRRQRARRPRPGAGGRALRPPRRHRRRRRAAGHPDRGVRRPPDRRGHRRPGGGGRVVHGLPQQRRLALGDVRQRDPRLRAAPRRRGARDRRRSRSPPATASRC